ncbi:MAG: hypothetical protein RL508_4 [Actinomycetota bacterium]|jgi:NAD+ diphosphatase
MHTPLGLKPAESAIDRDYLQRDNPDLFDNLWENPATRVLAMYEGQVLLTGNLSQPTASLKLLTTEEVPSAQLRVYLGKTLADHGHEPAGTPVVLAVLGTNSANQLEPDAEAWHGLRKTGAGLSPRDSEIYAQALALANFHLNHKHCPRCGLPTVIEQGGWSRRCFQDQSQTFPRTDPAIIVSVVDENDRILLGSQGVWEDNRWSVLAGFVEPGESLANAVVREVYEEAGVRVTDVEFLGSQAWPFPYSLMVAFTAKLDTSSGHQDLVPDGVEIEKVRWFSREEIAAERDGLILPGKLSVARSLLDHWFGEDIDGGSLNG